MFTRSVGKVNCRWWGRLIVAIHPFVRQGQDRKMPHAPSILDRRVEGVLVFMVAVVGEQYQVICLAIIPQLPIVEVAVQAAVRKGHQGNVDRRQ